MKFSEATSNGGSLESGKVRSDKGEDPADPSLSVITGDEEASTLTVVSGTLDDSTSPTCLDDFLLERTGFSALPGFCELAKLSQMA